MLCQYHSVVTQNAEILHLEGLGSGSFGTASVSIATDNKLSFNQPKSPYNNTYDMITLMYHRYF